ncbi:unnamed protein product [Sphenostylis stenocarpa]|uniref:Protein kinase domain-containing protein n=1 Tax=Sphenostylis stenocarpa TaxID=92480 RepID=A0AA86T151_9FABA|nr:unnamed protein product [Sphenostylis stenocarpa]
MEPETTPCTRSGRAQIMNLKSGGVIIQKKLEENVESFLSPTFIYLPVETKMPTMQEGCIFHSVVGKALGFMRKLRKIQTSHDGYYIQDCKLQQRGEVNVDKVKLFSLKELEKATDNFNTNRVLGKGGQATVYKGMLIDGTIIAVKKFKVQGKIEEFINEFVILSQINHRNVVKLLGSCLETKIPLLVYEFIPNGNLFEYLHEQNEDLPMTWDMRLRIATEVAGALFYLHSAASQPIYHKDIKSTNILLDEKYRAKVADFGTSRMISIDVTHLTTVVQGTFGYLDPEFFQTKEAKCLASHFVICKEENRVLDIIDERVMKEGQKDHIMEVVNLASRCLELNGKKRPTMKEATLELEGIRRLEGKSNAEERHNKLDVYHDCINEVICLFVAVAFMGEMLKLFTSSSERLLIRPSSCKEDSSFLVGVHNFSYGL